MTTLYSNPALLGRPVWLPGGDSLLVTIGSPKENRAQIWQIPYPEGQPRRFTNDLSDYTPYLDLTRDGRTLATLNETQISNIWAVPEGKAALACKSPLEAWWTLLSGRVRREAAGTKPGKRTGLDQSDGSQRTR